MTQREVLRKKIRLVTILTISLVLLAYGAFQARNLALGPMISIAEPANGSVVQSPTITIAGTAKNISYMTLNGLQIFADTDGNFHEDRLLLLGYNVLTIDARDKFGTEVKKTLEITYQ